jgi:hypothetical protein
MMAHLMTSEPPVLKPPGCPDNRGRQVPVDEDRAAVSPAAWIERTKPGLVPEQWIDAGEGSREGGALR